MTEPESAEPPAQRASGRVVALDLLRLLAAFQMVQGHTLDAVLAAEFRQGGVHALWQWSRGLTSVAFLFVAGLAFQLATLRDLAAHRADNKAVAARFRRAAMLVLLGYALHLPLPSAWGGGALAGALIVDILQCMGVMLALIELLCVLLPSRRAVEVACAALGIGLLALAPLSAVPVSGPLTPLLNYLSPRGGSLFPLLPWGAHMLLGVALGSLLTARPGAFRWLAAGAALLGLAFAARALGGALYADHLTRIGSVLIAGFALAVLGARVRRWPAWTLGLSQETLFIYVFHVLIVYGAGIGLASVVGARLSPLPASIVAAAMVAGSFAAALVYRRGVPGLARRTAPG